MNKRWTIDEDRVYFNLLVVLQALKLVDNDTFEELDWKSYELSLMDPMGDIWAALKKNKGSLPTP